MDVQDDCGAAAVDGSSSPPFILDGWTNLLVRAETAVVPAFVPVSMRGGAGRVRD